MRPIARFRWIAVALLAAGVVFPPVASAQARYYWKSLSGANVVPVIFESLSGNANPANPAMTVMPGASFSGTLGMAGYGRMFSLFDRAAFAALIVPMGRVSGEVNAFGVTGFQSASGFGDPMVELVVNVVGPRAQNTLADVARYEPGFSLDVLADLAFPIGQYSSSQALNLGQHRWYGRIGLPIVWQIGPWVPGQRTTVEALPAMWWFAANTDYLGKTLTTNVLFQLDAHVTRDLTASLWVSLDALWYLGGAATFDGVTGDKLNNFGIGATAGYQITENLGLTASYMKLVSSGSPNSLQMDRFMVSLIYGWHSLVEGARRLEENKK
ncbi:MAG: transporter [Deltaproteobacteria bacterium]